MINGKPATISSFTGKYRFLSNFYWSTVYFGGIDYPTVEHAYQACKTNDDKLRMMIRNASTPGAAKGMGKRVKIRDGWDDIRVRVMKSLLDQKFRNPDLRARLADTGRAELIEGNRYGDIFWGVCSGVGENMLGQLLMQVRREIK